MVTISKHASTRKIHKHIKSLPNDYEVSLTAPNLVRINLLSLPTSDVYVDVMLENSEFYLLHAYLMRTTPPLEGYKTIAQSSEVRGDQVDSFLSELVKEIGENYETYLINQHKIKIKA